MLKNFKDNKYVSYAFYGLRPASTGLIAAAGLSVIFSNLFIDETMNFGFLNWKGIILGVVLFTLTNFVPKVKKLHPIVFIGISAVCGIVFSM